MMKYSVASSFRSTQPMLSPTTIKAIDKIWLNLAELTSGFLVVSRSPLRHLYGGSRSPPSCRRSSSSALFTTAMPPSFTSIPFFLNVSSLAKDLYQTLAGFFSQVQSRFGALLRSRLLPNHHAIQLHLGPMVFLVRTLNSINVLLVVHIFHFMTDWKGSALPFSRFWWLAYSSR